MFRHSFALVIPILAARIPFHVPAPQDATPCLTACSKAFNACTKRCGNTGNAPGCMTKCGEVDIRCRGGCTDGGGTGGGVGR